MNIYFLIKLYVFVIQYKKFNKIFFIVRTKSTGCTGSAGSAGLEAKNDQPVPSSAGSAGLRHL
jgi:hypothetical protein